MSMLAVFEKLAMTTHLDPELNDIIQELPPNVSSSFHKHDFHRIRTLIAEFKSFSDITTIVQK